MDAGFTAEQEEIRRTLRELLHKRCGPEELRAALDTPAGHDPALWTALADRLGLPGLALPEEYGGAGCSVTELALAAEETGRALAPSPFLATAALATPLVRALGTAAQRADLLPRIANGTLTATLAVPGTALATALALTGDNGGEWAGGGRAGGVQARRAGEGWRLYGQAEQVLDGHSAGLLLVAAHTGGYARSRTLLFLVPGDADGVVRTRQTALDATRPQARVQLRDVRAELLGEDGAEVLGALARTGDTAAAVLACEAVGAADRTLERTVEYVLQREQFGRAIGSFQAVKHRLADVYVRVQAARSAAYYAAWAAAHGERVGALALAQALEALRTAAAEGIQLHGGIGFTWEHEAHLYFKRAAGDDLLFGPVHRLRAHAADAARLFEGREVTV
ncbi:acyl-CoA/acyl-ACP dehydrogenase [Streptomyces spinosirectus]|jgi:alkylation response protein AidB-like acyl-CoA dehydrogenase|uniref:acyl-CoA dehydrogenase family protein n=1 Tax=Streptomyces TaxID=1883 RepID=UPI000D3BE37A|nr:MULTISPECIES: acyl-CoA dehydrogenase family protein [Streptomyces]MBY8339831.1 acyl-CoA dehydrogenase family protein [Streptomyces plumbidurans]PTM98066.1 alkylation response protein AidB-like acyl-CoA dehydrogenase [Streptomyces sp. VMFN-G11Ma]UIR19778.1 acyl-CoA/acyl-ACP dehydrogenase [Streptomyces spinosirectus]